MTLDAERLDALLAEYLAEGRLEPSPIDLSPEGGRQLSEMLSAVARMQSVERPDVSAGAAREHQRLLRARLAEMRAARTPVVAARPIERRSWSRLGFWRLGPLPALVAASVTVVILLVGGIVGTAAASLPESPLYSLKLAGEKVQLALSMNEATRARVHLLLAER